LRNREGNETLAKARIFDDFGREVKTLFSNELMGTSGFFTWDGVNAVQAKSPIGMFDKQFIPNDLGHVVEKIAQYYG
jgi:hypothetical protein